MTHSHALLQKDPLDAWSGDEHHGVVEVLAVGSREEMEKCLAEYQEHHKLACREWEQWDDRSKEWDSDCDAKFFEICQRHGVSTLIEDVKFEIVRIGVGI